MLSATCGGVVSDDRQTEIQLSMSACLVLFLLGYALASKNFFSYSYFYIACLMGVEHPPHLAPSAPIIRHPHTGCYTPPIPSHPFIHPSTAAGRYEYLPTAYLVSERHDYLFVVPVIHNSFPQQRTVLFLVVSSSPLSPHLIMT